MKAGREGRINSRTRKIGSKERKDRERKQYWTEVDTKFSRKRRKEGVVSLALCDLSIIPKEL